MPTDMASQRVGPVSPIFLFFEEAVVHMMAQGHILDYDKAFDTDEPFFCSGENWVLPSW